MGSVAAYTTPTNIGLSMVEWMLVAKDDMQITGVSQADALNMVLKSVKALYDLPSDQKWKGFYYTYELSGGTPQKSSNLSLIHI